MTDFNIMTLDQEELKSILLGLIAYTSMLKTGIDVLDEEEQEQVELHIVKIDLSMFKLKQHLEDTCPIS
jgi:hypothetical protein